MEEKEIGCIALSGATSSIGIFLINKCIQRNIRVIAMYNFESIHASRVPTHPLIERVHCTLENMVTVNVSGLHADVFIHLAWKSTKSSERNNPVSQVCNIQYSLDSINLAKRLGCHTYMGAGSQAQYGKKNEILTEDISMNPDTGYGMAKLCAEQMTRLYCRMIGMRHIWPRIVSTYGPFSPEQTVIFYEIRSLLAGEKPALSGGDQLWDYIYLDDVADALLALMQRGRDGESYLISSGKSFPLKEIFIKVRDMIDPSLPLGLGDIPYNENTVMYLCASIKKIQQDTGWSPKTSFEEGVRKTIEWVKATTEKEVQRNE